MSTSCSFKKHEITYKWALILNSKILNKSLNDFKCKENDDFSVQQNNLINALNTNLNNCISAAHSCGNSKAEKYLKNISDKRVSSFEEALQRILWYNQIMWQ